MQFAKLLINSFRFFLIAKGYDLSGPQPDGGSIGGDIFSRPSHKNNDGSHIGLVLYLLLLVGIGACIWYFIGFWPVIIYTIIVVAAHLAFLGYLLMS